MIEYSLIVDKKTFNHYRVSNRKSYWGACRSKVKVKLMMAETLSCVNTQNKFAVDDLLCTRATVQLPSDNKILHNNY